MTKKFSFRRVTLAVLATLLVVCAAFTLLSVKGKTAFAADFSYKEGRDGYTYNADSSLTVKFTVTGGGQEIGGAFNTWIVYLIHENTGITYNPTTHKYTDNSDRGSNVAAYYFPVDSTGQTGAGSHTVTVASDAIAYRGSPSSATNYGINTGKTFAEVFETENWIVGVGPMFNAWWSSGVAAPIDYYVGRAADVLANTVTFRNYDESVISSSSLSLSADITIPAYTALDANAYEFLGWYCDTTDKIYSAAQIADLKVSDVVDSTRSVNFYAAYNQKFSKYIEFTTSAVGTDDIEDGDDNKLSKIVDTTDNVADTITVVYDITHNDGVNEILLIPEYDREVFSIASVESVSVKNDTVLGVAEIGTDGRYAIELGSTTLYTELDASFITITFTIDESKVATAEYTFGLKLYSRTANDSSKAIYKDVGGNIYDMGIVVKTKTLALSAIKDSTIRSRSHTFTYSKQAVTAACVDNYTHYEYNNSALTVYFDYDGDATSFTYNWYENDGVTPIANAPMTVGDYYLDVTAPKTFLYKATTKRIPFSIVRRELTVTIADKTSEYLDAILPLTSSVDGTVYAGDEVTIALSTTATSSSPVGEYAITGVVNGGNNNSQYQVTFVNGVYTIAARAITITAGDQNATYSGTEPYVNPSLYTVTRTVGGATEELPAGATVVLTKAEGVNVGTYDIVPSSVYFVDNANYAVTYENGTFTITTVTTGEVAVIKNFFKGINGNPYETTYNGLYQKLVVTTTETPAWVINHIVDSNGYYKRDAGTYDGITVTLSFNAQDAANYTNGEQSIVFTVDAVINKATITLTAENKSAIYGDDAKELTYSITSGTLYQKSSDISNEEKSDDALTASFITKNGDDIIVISNTTPVGQYTIVVSATNPNYDITVVDGTYTIVKAPISDNDGDNIPDDVDDNDESGIKISLSATDVFYNRDLVYAHTVKVGTQVLAGNAYTVKFYSDSDCTNEVVPENAGTYYIKVSVAETDNYYGASKVTSFDIKKIQLSAPTASYNGAKVTLSEVATDAGDLALKEGTTVYYTINDVDCTSNRSYTATSVGTFAFVISSDNDNYIPYEETTKNCYSIAFTEGVHAYNPVVLEVPATLYCFNTSSVILPAALNLDGYNFVSWDGHNAKSAYAPSANVTLDAIWSAIGYTVSFKYTESGEIAYSNTFYYGQAVTYPTATVVPVKNSDNVGIYYSFADKWTKDATEYAFTTEEGIATVTGVNVYGDMVFVAVFDKNFNTFTLTYYVSQNEATTGYVQFGETQVLSYGAVITYLSYTSNYQWFKTDFWYLDAARTQSVPVTMPNANIEVYGSYKFDIGAGDVNADGIVNADDITLYRQWIVGGYTMTIVESGREWETAQNYDADTRYFLKRVADINTDESKDIRDVSITRMAIVEGYNWDILTNENVSGAEIVRTYQSITVNEIASRLNSGKRVILGNNIEDVNGVIEVNFSGNVYIDLNGKTLTVYSFAVNTDKKDATIIVKNGTIITTNGITVTAPNGNVILEDLIGYVNNSQINLQAASSSLHFAGAVAFYKESGSTATENIAPIYVAENTHVVVEDSAEVVVEKIVVSTVTVIDDKPVFTADATKAVSLDNKTETVLELDGVNSNTDAAIGDKNYDTLQKAIDAALVSDSNDITINLLRNVTEGSGIATKSGTGKNITIDFNGYTYTMVNPAVGSTGTETQALHFEKAAVTLKNGTFNVAENAANVKMALQNYTDLTIENMTMDFSNISLEYYGTTDNFDPINGKYKKYSGLEFPVFNTNAGASIIINNSTLTFNSASNFGVYVETTATITDSTINGSVALSTDSGNGSATIVNSTITKGVVAYFAKDFVLNVGNAYTAYENLQAAIDAAGTTAATIALFGNTSGNGAIVRENQNITFDFNGFTYNVDGTTVGSAGTETNGFQLLKGATVIFKDGTLKTVNAKILIQNYAETTLDNFVVTGEGAENLLYVASNNFGSLNVSNGSKILAYNNQVAFDLWYGMSPVYYDGITVTLGSDTEVRGKVEMGAATSAKTGFAEKAKLIVEDGAVWDETITLSNNLVLTAPWVFDFDCTLELAGKTISNTNDIWLGDNWSLISVQGGTLTISGEGTLRAKENDCYAIDVQNGANLIINGGTYVGNISAVYVYEGSLTVNGGTFSIQQLASDVNGANPYRFLLNCLDQNYKNGTATITVTGGNFVGVNPAASTAESPTANFVAAGYTITETNGVYTVVKE